MRAVEFRTKIRDDKILLPRKIRKELINGNDKNVKVVIFFKDSEVYDDYTYRQITKNQFLKGYANTDSIYKNKNVKDEKYFCKLVNGHC